MGRSKLRGYMLSLPFRFCDAVISLQHAVGPIIIWLVIGGVTCLQDKWGDVEGSQNMCGPIIEVAVMDVNEEDLGVHLSRSTSARKETHCLYPDIPIHISRWRTVH